jgi:hypothetical protein
MLLEGPVFASRAVFSRQDFQEELPARGRRKSCRAPRQPDKLLCSESTQAVTAACGRQRRPRVGHGSASGPPRAGRGGRLGRPRRTGPTSHFERRARIERTQESSGLLTACCPRGSRSGRLCEVARQLESCGLRSAGCPWGSGSGRLCGVARQPPGSDAQELWPTVCRLPLGKWRREAVRGCKAAAGERCSRVVAYCLPAALGEVAAGGCAGLQGSRRGAVLESLWPTVCRPPLGKWQREAVRGCKAAAGQRCSKVVAQCPPRCPWEH